MERLTVDTMISFCDIAQCRETPGGSFCEDGYCDQRRVYERLRAYEQTGLEPEEILPAKDAGMVAVCLMRQTELERLAPYERLFELAQADKEGRVLVLPEPPKGV